MAAGAIATGVAPGILSASGTAIPPSDKIRVATLGMGIMGFGDTRYCTRVPGVELVGVADCYTGRLTRAKEMFGPNLFTTRDYREILSRKDIDAVVIAAPDHWHVPLAVAALEAGKHVYLEKPAVHQVEEGHKLIDAVKKTGKKLQVGSQRVSSVEYGKAKEWYEAGKIGKLNLVEARMSRNSSLGAWQYAIPDDASPATCDWETFQGTAPRHEFDPVRFFRWRNYREYGTGVGGDLFVHLLSGIHHILGSNGPTRIMATGGLRFWNDGRNVPDVLMGLFDYPETASHPAFSLALSVNFVDAGGEGEMFRFVGSEGMISIGRGLKLTRNPRQNPSEEEYFRGYNSMFTFPKEVQDRMLEAWRKDPPAAQTEAATEEEFHAPADYNDQYEHIRNFFAAIRGEKEIVEDATFGLRAAAPAVLANTSFFEERTVSWDPVAMRLV